MEGSFEMFRAFITRIQLSKWAHESLPRAGPIFFFRGRGGVNSEKVADSCGGWRTFETLARHSLQDDRWPRARSLNSLSRVPRSNHFSFSDVKRPLVRRLRVRSFPDSLSHVIFIVLSNSSQFHSAKIQLFHAGCLRNKWVALWELVPLTREVRRPGNSEHYATFC